MTSRCPSLPSLCSTEMAGMLQAGYSRCMMLCQSKKSSKKRLNSLHLKKPMGKASQPKLKQMQTVLLLLLLSLKLLLPRMNRPLRNLQRINLQLKTGSNQLRRNLLMEVSQIQVSHQKLQKVRVVTNRVQMEVLVRQRKLSRRVPQVKKEHHRKHLRMATQTATMWLSPHLKS